MKEDIRRFIVVILISLVAGFLTHQVVLCILIGILLFQAWYYRYLKQLYLWLQRRSGANPPELPGIIDEICREVDFLRARHKQRKDKLAGFLRRFQDATAAMPDAIIILDEIGVIEWANEKATEYLGVRWPQDGGQRVANLIRNPQLSAFLNKTDAYRDYTGRSLQLVSPDNPDQVLEFRLAPYGENQKLLVARDITGIQRINQIHKDFIANASHELRTPLTVISGYLEGLDDDNEDFSVVVKTQIRQMRRQSERMHRLVEDLLTLSVLEATPEIMVSESVPVPEMLVSIYQEAEGLSGALEHIFYLETDPTLWIKGNQRELYSAFSNLVYNAVQHTSARGIIRLRWYADNEGAHFSVADNGSGIAPEHITRITERFYRIDKGRSRNGGGTGLGLAIVKNVLARHKALLHIESTVGKGSLFRCDFPSDQCIINLESSQQAHRL